MAAHRYWKIAMTSRFSGTVNGLSEVEMYTSVGGTDILTSPTVTVSSTSAGAAANLVDNNVSTFWASNFDGSAGYVIIDLGLGNDADVKEIGLRCRTGSEYQQGTKAGDVLSSDNGSTFTLAWSFADKCAGGGYLIRCPNPAFVVPGITTHRFWGLRVNTVQNGGTLAAVQELEMRATSGGTDTCTGGDGITNTEWTAEPVNAFDDNSGTVADFQAIAPTAATIAYDFGAAVAVPVQLAITTDVAIRSPVTFDLVYSDDNQNWTIQQSYTTTADWVDGETRLFGVASTIHPFFFINEPIDGPFNLRCRAKRVGLTYPSFGMGVSPTDPTLLVADGGGLSNMLVSIYEGEGANVGGPSANVYLGENFVIDTTPLGITPANDLLFEVSYNGEAFDLYVDNTIKATWEYDHSAGDEFWAVFMLFTDNTELYDIRWYRGSSIQKSGVGATVTVQASEDITQHDFVNIYNSGGSARVRKADATDPTKFANGWAPFAIASGAPGEIALPGSTNPLTIATAANEVWLSDSVPGSYVTAAPSTSGYLVQSLGTAINGVGIIFQPGPRITL